MHALEDITVVALEQAVAAPLATRQLADLGARVIKIERPGVGDFARGYDRTVHGESSYFVWLNRGKESIELNLKDGSDRSLLDRLLEQADVFVQNLIPGAVERLGLAAEVLRADRPELIHCSISGYGPEGPYRAKKAYDLLIQCEAGLLETTGTPETPAKVGISVADIATGMYAYGGVLAALYERKLTGVGSTLDVALIDSLGEWMMQPIYYSVYGKQPARRTGARHASIAPYGPYRTGDGAFVYVGVQNDREWAVLCHDILAQPELIDDGRFVHNPERVANNEQLTAIIEAAFAGVDADRLVVLLDAADIACARMRTPAEFFEHPQLRARNRWREVPSPGGSIPALVSPISVRGRQPLMRPVPRLGEHNASIRAEFNPDHRRRAKRARPGAELNETVLRTEFIIPGPAEALATLLGTPAPNFHAGDRLPLFWHWVYLLERPAQTDLGHDGHPTSGTVLAPPGPNRRRMFAGGHIRSLGRLRCGEAATRRTRVLDAREKHGRTGSLTFVRVAHQILQAGGVVIDECQDIVYRNVGKLDDSDVAVVAGDDPPKRGATQRPAKADWSIDVTPTLLFRFSALTYNAHRIHYDRDYARETEGYPGLVTHGPLQVLAMTEAARARGSDAELACDYRLIAPLFDYQGLIAGATAEGGTFRASVRDIAGRQTARATITTIER